MPSVEVYNILLNKGILPPDDRYSRNDTLADKPDLERLFEVLLSFRDSSGRPAVMTPVTNVANPDFNKIRDSGFAEYYYEPFNETIIKYGRDPETFNTWRKGLDLGIFVPELHGREHISVQLWLKTLRAGEKNLLTAFNHGVPSINVERMHPAVKGFRPEFYFDNDFQTDFLIDSISDGINIFRNLFGYIPRSFVPSNNIFHPIFEGAIAKAGVKYLYVSHFSPVPGKNGRLRIKYYKTGKLTTDGIRYYTRNCAFEPTEVRYQGIDLTIKQIEAAFRWGKPANISTHRVNFIGSLNERNRTNGLRELSCLLQAIVARWPDVEFMSSSDMFKAVYEKS